MALDIYTAPVNNVGLDPLQGFDVACWLVDSGSGEIALFGDFQSLTLTVRDSTETYLPLGTRFPVYLNGEIQIAFVIEQGLVDMNFLQRTFGVQRMTREQLITRGPRFQLSFDANANELQTTYRNVAVTKITSKTAEQRYRLGGTSFSQIVGGENKNFASNRLTGPQGAQANQQVYDKAVPLASGRYDLQRCKIDSLSLGIMPGRRVIAQRWEGVAEGITFVPESLQNFRERNLVQVGPSPSFNNGGNPELPAIPASSFTGSATTLGGTLV